MLILHDFSSILCFFIKESFLIEISAKSVVLRFIAVLLFLLHYQLLTCQFHIGSFASSQPSNCEFFQICIHDPTVEVLSHNRSDQAVVDRLVLIALYRVNCLT